MKKSKEKNANAIYDEIFNNTNAKGQRSIENIRKMCDYCDENSVIITVRKIGQLLETNGLMPKMQTLRNNRKISEYIKMRAKSQNMDINNIEESSKDIEFYKNENRMLKAIIANFKIM